MKKLRIVTIVLSLMLFISNVASASGFSDMPADPASQQVIENAVKNGLLSGYDDGTVRPDAYITRAEMAAIITRACGAAEEGDILKFTDVNPDAWYYSAISKAYKMGALSGSNGNMNPDNLITFQECFTVLSQVFDLVPQYVLLNNYDGSDLPANTILDGRRLYDLSQLTQYSDYSDVAAWAKIYMAGVVEHGGWSGTNNMLTPNANITRLQFATVMDNLFKNYIDTPGTYNSLPEGNTLVRCDGVIFENIETNDDIYISDCVSPNGITIKNVNCGGRIVVRGCATPTVKENGSVTFGGFGISLSGSFEMVRVIRPYINIDLRGATYGSIYSIPKTSVSRFVKN